MHIFQIEILVRDTRRQEVHAAKAVLKEVLPHGVLGMIGSSSSNPTVAMATLAGLADTVLVGFLAGTTKLSDKSVYKTFARVNPTIKDEVRSIARLMQCTC